MAELLRTTERNYQYYESDAREPNLETFVEISDILNVSTSVGRMWQRGDK